LYACEHGTTDPDYFFSRDPHCGEVNFWMLVDEPVFEPEVKRRSVSSYHALNEARQFRISQAFVNDMAGGDCKNTGAGIYEACLSG
jgi:hypothetical protein